MKKFPFASKQKGAMGMENLIPIIMSIAIAVMALGLVLTFLGKFNTNVEAMVAAAAVGDNYSLNNASYVLEQGMIGLGEFNNWWSLISIAAIFLILFAVLFAIARTGSTNTGGGF